jgi:hypothetical protein
MTPFTVLAAPAPKPANVSLSASNDTILVGETATLTATTLKQGSSFTDSWDGAVKDSTILDDSLESYVSTATFSSSVPGAYTITYDIIMKAGKSNVTFVGTEGTTITVIAPKELIGATIKNLSATPRYNPQQKLIGYDAIGEVYAVYNNGDEDFYDAINFNFSPNQSERNIDVAVDRQAFTVHVVNPSYIG